MLSCFVYIASDSRPLFPPPAVSGVSPLRRCNLRTLRHSNAGYSAPLPHYPPDSLLKSTWSYLHTGTLHPLISFASHSYENCGCVPKIPILELTSPLHIRLSFQSLPRCPFCNSFLFTFMHGMGGMGVLPTFQRSNVPSVYPLSLQLLTDTPPQQQLVNPFAISPLRTLLTSTEGVPPSLPPYFVTSLLPYLIACSSRAVNHLPVSWTSHQFPPAEPSCTLKLSQSKVRP